MSLHVIGLISGGKDSLFSLAHCIENGHKIVAIANLYPAGNPDHGENQDGVEERPDLDSFMYQTVGHSIIPLYSEALDLPLYRRQIRGTATQTGRYYDSTAVYHVRSHNENMTDLRPSESFPSVFDETEDMFLLLESVLQHHPDANAVCAGAILSTYQRTRVESVAVRLGLTPLAYLWQYPALPPSPDRADSLTGLLDDMEACGCDARIIKIASGGIRSNLIFANVTDPSTKTRLVSGLAQFHDQGNQEYGLRAAVLGEGGEYETLALNGPHSLWKKRIAVDSVGSFEAEGGAVYTRFGKAFTTRKTDLNIGKIPIPKTLDLRFEMVQKYALHSLRHSIQNNVVQRKSIVDSAVRHQSYLKSSTSLHLFNISSPLHTVTEQLEHIINSIPGTIKTAGLWQNDKAVDFQSAIRRIVSTTLVLRSMQDFSVVNQIYSQKLWPQGLPNPPARVTIAAPLPENMHISLSLTFDMGQDSQQDKYGIHVQSRSYWAPANIGPYSQAISTSVSVGRSKTSLKRQTTTTPLKIIYMAGQIPLVPSSMILHSAGFVEQAVLALQHLWRVGQERGVDTWAGAGVAYLSRDNAQDSTDASVVTRVHQAARIWRLSHCFDERGFGRSNDRPDKNGSISEEEPEDDEAEFDIWNQQRNWSSTNTKLTVGEHLHQLPNHRLVSRDDSQTALTAIETTSRMKVVIPQFIAAEVSQLPRNASIEWWSTGLAGLTSEVGRQCYNVVDTYKRLGTSCTISGMALEYRDHTSSERGGSVNTDKAYLQADMITLFVTLLVHVNKTVELEISEIPKSLRDLEKFLIGPANEYVVEVVTATSFVNLNAPPTVRETVDSMLLVSNSTVVPCHRVWASTRTSPPQEMRNSNSTNAKEKSASEIKLDHGLDSLNSDVEGDVIHQIEEMGAAIVLRIDAYPV